MRTTIDIDDDVLARARKVAAQRDVPVDRVVSDTLRASLPDESKPITPRPYKTVARDMGLRPGVNLDNIQDLLDELEGETRL